MDKTVVMLTVMALLVGAVFGGWVTNMATPVKTVTNEVVREVPVEVQVPGPETTVEVEVPVFTADASLFYTEAVDAVFDEIGDDDDFLTCGSHEFDEDEVSVNRVKEWSYSWLDDDEYEVALEVKLEFEDNSDERDCKDTRSYTVFFEEGEDPVVS